MGCEPVTIRFWFYFTFHRPRPLCRRSPVTTSKEVWIWSQNDFVSFFCLKRKKKEERVMIQFDISTSAFSSETKNRVWQKVENVWKLKITLFTSGCCCCSDEDKLRSCFCQPSSTTSDNNFNFVKRFGFDSVPSCWPSPPPSSPSSGNKTWQTIQEDLQRPKSSILLRATQNSLPLSGLPASVKQLQTRVLKREH